MTTIIPDTAVSGLDLVGRPAIVDQRLTTITAVDGQRLSTALDPDASLEAPDVLLLPHAGEYVEMPDVIPSPVQGYWLGPVDETRIGEHFAALVLVGTRLTEVVMPTNQADARRLVTGAAIDPAPMQALLAEARAHRRTRRENAEWVDRLVSIAHEEADDRGWCTEFDDVCDRIGIPRRTRDYDLRVEVTATVLVSRSATNADEAIDSLTREDVWAALSADNIEWDAEED